MATKIILPKLGQTMEEGLIVEWNKKEGDPVARGDVLFQLESDKAVLEVEARNNGVLRKILLEPGIKVPVGTVVGIIAEPDEDISALLAEVGGGAPEKAAPAPQAEPTEERGAQQPQAAQVAAPIHPAGERIFSSPRARKLARERGIDLAMVAGSGPGGRIIEKDVRAYLERQPAATPLAQQIAAREGVSLEGLAPAGERVRAAAVREALKAPGAPPVAPAPVAPAPGEVKPLTGVRAIIAQRMAASAHTTAPVTLQSVVDVTEFVKVREQLRAAFAEELGFAIGYNDLLAVIVARCLREFPYMNVRLEEEAEGGGAVIRYLEHVNLGMAVDSERGLLVPVIRDADKMGVKELARTFRELVERARLGKALPDDLTGGTFTITNLGMFGVDMFTPIINLPETAILGVGRIKPEPVAINGQVEIRQRMWLSLTFDHRLVDGAPAARFLQGIMRYIEAPYLLLA
ncbi:MAG: 2-oxo acid dehydrogenase subunit E2 [Chloroflexi bacterium]|nr:2-oxo acid dehydrogenase subunit E2 [Chloroflexota bacterium]